MGFGIQSKLERNSNKIGMTPKNFKPTCLIPTPKDMVIFRIRDALHASQRKNCENNPKRISMSNRYLISVIEAALPAHFTGNPLVECRGWT